MPHAVQHCAAAVCEGKGRLAKLGTTRCTLRMLGIITVVELLSATTTTEQINPRR